MFTFHVQYNVVALSVLLYFILFFDIKNGGVDGRQPRHVTDFKYVTWNSDGPKWQAALQYFDSSGADVMALQEAGQIDSSFILTSRMTTTTFLGITPLTEGLVILEYEVRGRNGATSHYIYYHDRTTRDAEFYPKVDSSTKPPKKEEVPTKQNMAIITREPVHELFVLPMIGRGRTFLTPGDPRYNVNRPVIGARIDNAVFFCVHAEPSDTSNEALDIVDEITSDLYAWNPSYSWIIMGDFNREDDFLQNDRNVIGLGAPNNVIPPNFSRFSARTGQPTRYPRPSSRPSPTTRAPALPRELDYAIIGAPSSVYSPTSVQFRTRKFVADLLPNLLAARNLPLIPNLSDHIPVFIRIQYQNVKNG